MTRTDGAHFTQETTPGSEFSFAAEPRMKLVAAGAADDATPTRELHAPTIAIIA